MGFGVQTADGGLLWGAEGIRGILPLEKGGLGFYRRRLGFEMQTAEERPLWGRIRGIPPQRIGRGFGILKKRVGA